MCQICIVVKQSSKHNDGNCRYSRRGGVEQSGAVGADEGEILEVERGCRQTMGTQKFGKRKGHADWLHAQPKGEPQRPTLHNESKRLIGRSTPF